MSGQGCYIYKGRDLTEPMRSPIKKEYAELYGLDPMQGGLWYINIEDQIRNRKHQEATGLDEKVESGDIVLLVFDFKPSDEDLAWFPECEWVYPPENLWSRPKDDAC